MDMGKYWWGSRREVTPTIRLGRSYTYYGGYAKPHPRGYWSGSHGKTKPTVWQVLLRKLGFRRDRSKKLSKSRGGMEGTYNQQTYSLNFDQGLGWMETDNLCRSFSARFAVPSSRIFPPTHLLDC
ncbi:uncharacterized protein LOC129303939 [Prosopis cineraria]|uniref:uncharacterized protein LOC129303939 n=1 Tax=Prosopis cineraria TaxID=364024 RepID=UPI00240FD17A|nr:uncharacterized protein LOC129303939 [Prosopis cineraria]